MGCINARHLCGGYSFIGHFFGPSLVLSVFGALSCAVLGAVYDRLYLQLYSRLTFDATFNATFDAYFLLVFRYAIEKGYHKTSEWQHIHGATLFN